MVGFEPSSHAACLARALATSNAANASFAAESASACSRTIVVNSMSMRSISASSRAESVAKALFNGTAL